MSQQEAAEMLERLIENKSLGNEIGLFMEEYSGNDKLILDASYKLFQIQENYPKEKESDIFCNEKGTREIENLIRVLRESDTPESPT